jgi:CBS domain-containing protein
MDAEPIVADIMSKDVLVVAPTSGVTDAARLMVEHAVSGLPVVDHGQLVGIVTETDIISWQIEVDPPVFGTFLDAIFRLPWDQSEEELRRVLATTVAGLMTEEVVTISPNATVNELASLMYKRKVNPVPVVDAHGSLVGIASRTDIIRLLLRSEDTPAGDSAS